MAKPESASGSPTPTGPPPRPHTGNRQDHQVERVDGLLVATILIRAGAANRLGYATALLRYFVAMKSCICHNAPTVKDGNPITVQRDSNITKAA